MSTSLHRAATTDLAEVTETLASWQQDGLPVQVHPGDLGWNSGLGAQRLADELWLWRRSGTLVALGMGDSDVLRLAVCPDIADDPAVADAVASDLTEAERGVLTGPSAQVEVRFGAALQARLRERGWVDDEPWTPLRRSLARPVPDCGLRIETLDAEHVDDELVRDRVAVQRASFDRSTFTAQRWHEMAASPAYRRGRCLIGYDEAGHAVAATTVWSAGVGRTGLIESLGAHRDYRGRGHGRAITLAAAAALREMGASSVAVCTPAANTRGVAAYVSAGFDRLPDVPDLRRPDMTEPAVPA